MEPFLNYLKKRGGIVNHHIQRGNVPSDEQLANFTKETVAKFKELARSARDEHCTHTCLLGSTGYLGSDSLTDQRFIAWTRGPSYVPAG